MNILFLINDAPYGNERVYNALRLAQALLKREAATQITIFLLGDSVLAAKAKQKTPEGYYNIERMLGRIVSGNGIILTCGTCMDARGMADSELVNGAQRSTMDKLRGSDDGCRQGSRVLSQKKITASA
jgi:uncharacterized protein involved in oxidation of intracellular sulfur